MITTFLKDVLLYHTILDQALLVMKDALDQAITLPLKLLSLVLVLNSANDWPRSSFLSAQYNIVSPINTDSRWSDSFEHAGRHQQPAQDCICTTVLGLRKPIILFIRGPGLAFCRSERCTYIWLSRELYIKSNPTGRNEEQCHLYYYIYIGQYHCKSRKIQKS